jgi:uncharacterized protein (TIGR01777 family)
MTDAAGTIVIPGGSGYLGGVLADYFARQCRPVVILSRRKRIDDGPIRYAAWDGETPGEWAREFEGAAAIVNLAGRSVNCRYNARNRQEIYDSRLRSTKAVGEAIARCADPPPVWINASSATIYRHALDRPMDEASGEIGTGFSVDVCLKWERALAEADTPQTRKVALRTAIVFGPGGGAFEAFHSLVRRGLGGTLGRGDQFVSWIHAEDFARSVEWIIRHAELEGPVNCAAPNPLPNREFMRLLREACGKRTETELLLKSRRVVPGKLLASGFQFRFPHWEDAVRNILAERSCSR